MAKAPIQKPAPTARASRAAKPFKTAAAPLKPSPSPVQTVATMPAKPAAPTKSVAKPAKTSAASKAAKADKGDKAKKPKLMRDSFTIPKTEYVVIDALKERAARAGVPAKKSELLRAGIKALAAMDDAGFLAAVKEVPAIKTGRPAKV